MAETIQGLTIKIEVTGSVVGSDGANQRVQFTKDYTFTEGTGNDQLGSWFYDASRALNATSEDLDLAGGLTDFTGTALALNNLKFILAENLDTDSGDTLTFKPGSSNPVSGIQGGTSPTLVIPPGGFFLWVDPNGSITVTGGSADTIAFETADNSTYKLFLGGDNA